MSKLKFRWETDNKKDNNIDVLKISYDYTKYTRENYIFHVAPKISPREI